MITITKDEARELVARLNLHGTPAHAAYQIGLELRAIEPYTCCMLSRLQFVLRKMSQATDERQTAARATLAKMVESDRQTIVIHQSV